MSVLRKLRQRTYIFGEPANPGSPETVRCPPAPPGYYYTVVNGEYRLVSGYRPPVGTPTGSGSCPPITYRRECAPNPIDPTLQDCYWVPDLPLGVTRIC
jgi:hypothetical protein